MAADPMIFKLALSLLKKVHADTVRQLYEKGYSAEDFFSLDRYELWKALGLHQGHGLEKKDLEDALDLAKREFENMRAHNIRGYFLMDEDYPVRLGEIPDAPVILYQLGNTNLDSRHVINVVGTRKPTSYGIDFTGRLINDLSHYFPDLLVVSGLAYGIDAAAHQGALDSGLPTVAVVAHGLNMIYPATHRDFARKIIKEGGSIVSEYPFGTSPYRQRFLERNRIIAGLSDITVVAESDIKGGAMSTANTAFSYSRDVMAVPGRVTDKLSFGCNHLIRKEKARMITSAADLVELSGWQPLDLKIDTTQRNLFPELDGDMKVIYDAIRFEKDPLQVDRIQHLTQIPVSRLLSILGEMEFDGIVIRHPGNRYSIS